jgi:hypothetical protein
MSKDKATHPAPVSTEQAPATKETERSVVCGRDLSRRITAMIASSRP